MLLNLLILRNCGYPPLPVYNGHPQTWAQAWVRDECCTDWLDSAVPHTSIRYISAGMRMLQFQGPNSSILSEPTVNTYTYNG
ncbi:putative Bloom syndrome protein like protein [Fusarium oxysporum f. sp. albedinis]|nr:putative Bloom syndrome protein like protein [Fusarium oxysporum f. sp. albedinis]